MGRGRESWRVDKNLEWRHILAGMEGMRGTTAMRMVQLEAAAKSH